MAAVVNDGARVGEEVAALRRRFTELQYCFTGPGVRAADAAAARADLSDVARRGLPDGDEQRHGQAPAGADPRRRLRAPRRRGGQPPPLRRARARPAAAASWTRAAAAAARPPGCRSRATAPSPASRSTPRRCAWRASGTRRSPSSRATCSGPPTSLSGPFDLAYSMTALYAVPDQAAAFAQLAALAAPGGELRLFEYADPHGPLRRRHARAPELRVVAAAPTRTTSRRQLAAAGWRLRSSATWARVPRWYEEPLRGASRPRGTPSAASSAPTGTTSSRPSTRHPRHACAAARSAACSCAPCDRPRGLDGSARARTLRPRPRTHHDRGEAAMDPTPRSATSSSRTSPTP